MTALVFHYSVNGLLADEGTDYLRFCFELLDRHGGADSDDATLDLLRGASVHLMGRNAYEGMAAALPGSDHPWAGILTAGNKVVLSRTLTTAAWANTTIATGDTATEVDQLRRGEGYVLVWGGARLWRSLVRLDLLDEFHLGLHPWVADEGTPLFQDVPPGYGWTWCRPPRWRPASSSCTTAGTADLGALRVGALLTPPGRDVEQAQPGGLGRVVVVVADQQHTRPVPGPAQHRHSLDVVQQRVRLRALGDRTVRRAVGQVREQGLRHRARDRPRGQRGPLRDVGGRGSDAGPVALGLPGVGEQPGVAVVDGQRLLVHPGGSPYRNPAANTRRPLRRADRPAPRPRRTARAASHPPPASPPRPRRPGSRRWP